MISFSTDRNPPWFFQYIENYSHILMDIKFSRQDIDLRRLNFTIEIDVQGFEGLLFYIYRPRHNQLKFDIIDHKTDYIHIIKDLYAEVDGRSNISSLDFIIIPFGQFHEANKFTPRIRCARAEASYQVYTWSPSKLFKNVKSIIKISNKYNDLVPIDDHPSYYYNFDISFKGNKTEFLFTLINLMVSFDDSPQFETVVSDIKELISKSNEYLFELSEKTIPLELQNLLKELERLKFNIDNLSKEEIFNWLDDLIDFYTTKL